MRKRSILGLGALFLGTAVISALARLPLALVMVMADVPVQAETVTGTVWVAKYALSDSVAIERGENAGRTITYMHVVRSLDRIGIWSGSEPEEVAMPQPGPGEGVAIWIQDGDAGPIMAATKIENP